VGIAVPQERGTSSSRYTILGRLASGGMADIFLVLATTDAGVDRHLVLKRVLAERARDPTFVKMFLDEARLSAQLQHPNIAQVFDVGKLAGSYFYTMEYVHGEDVRALLKRMSSQRKVLPENLALYIASGALAALHHAHDRTTPDGKPLNIVHRDVSPSNVMVSYEGAVKLLDFGVAKASQRSTESRSGSIKGKMTYLSPEQVRGTVVDRRSDIFSMGIVLYEMLTCKRLFKRENDFGAMMAIANDDVPPPSRLRPGLSSEIDRVVMTALEKDRDRRYASAAAMLEDIEAVATADRHLLSASAMSRFMRDVFGSKVEPWIELQTESDPDKPVTVTSESLSEDGGTTSLAGIPAELDAVLTKLDDAPDLWTAEPTPTPSGVVDAVPTVEGVVRPTPTPTLPVYRPTRRKLLPWLIAVALVGGAAAFAIVMVGNSSDPASRADEPTRTSAIASVDASPPPAEPPRISEPVKPAPPDEPVPAKPSPPTIAQAAALSDWDAVLKACSDAPTITAAERTNCGVAACNRKQRSVALNYLRGATGAARSSIERTCRERGISLATAPAAAPAKRNPCLDPAYVEANPLRCQ
jgi:serine/threonine protein kinase